MKNKSNISFFRYAFIALVFMGALTACVNDENLSTDIMQTGSERLVVSPIVSESLVKRATTRSTTPSVDSLQEKALNTLDVFVEHIANGTGEGTFLKQYHLTNAIEGNLNELAKRWRKEGLEEGEKYNIYVAANNPLTKVDVADVAALKALTYNEKTAGIASLDKDGNIGLKGNATSGSIYKRYSGTITGRAYTDSMAFMMDGVIKNWTPDPSTLDQTFDVTMNRAAAKIVLNVKFDSLFVRSLAYNKDNDGKYSIAKPDAEKVTITGTPAWKFNNFAFGAPVFAPDTAPTAGEEVHNSGFNIYHNQSIEGGNPFTIVTYSYPNKWTDATGAPSLVVSVGYTQGTGDDAVTTYNYYRIPIVSKETSSLNRNTIYVIDATIKTRGSDSHEDVTEMSDLIYEVLPWNDESNSAAIHNEVEPVQHYYLKVNPKVYTLRGDGDQSVPITYLKAAGTKVNWKLFTYDAEGNQTGVVANDDEAATRAWFYNASGAFTATYSDDSDIDWTKMGVNIEQSTEGTSDSKGTITVTSTALTNKAIKYIRLRVYLDETNDQGESLEGTYHEDIIIRHFPTDNIQNIAGSWSSYHDASGSTDMVTLTTRSLSVAQSWVEEYGVEYTTQQVTTTDNITYANYAAHTGEDGYAIANAQATTNRSTFRTQVQDNDQRAAANGQANAVLGEDGYCYWGVNPSRYYGGGDDDYYTGSGWNAQSYRYATLYRARYTHTYTYTQYSVTVPAASTGDWVDWDATDKANHSDNRQYTITYGNNAGTFNAKAMNGTTMYAIEENSHGNYGNRYYSTDLGDAESLTNNHMYVIQISSTSSSYVLGRPYINQSTHQSDDNVVSPAFMIASQLGAVLPFTGNNGPANAATHCSRYMEVAEDGTRYSGWRLPTEAEISVITGYQYGEIGGVTIPSAYQVIVPVLTGQWYHSLSGQEVEANPNAGQGSTTRSYLRCVRDLSAEEVDRLNGFDKIQEKYQ
ncbi:MAG: hypothetical protein IJL61_00380 [Bacteroidales bacterium]|nr:hypothetical protein [Bacteroidales bacterium]